MPVITNSLSGTSAKLLDNTNVTLRFDSSSFTNQVVTLADKTYTNKITITRPFELIASNIKKGVEIAGITGTYEVVLNTETVETPLSMKDGNQVILPSKPNYTLSEVTIVKPNTLVADNIKAGVEIGGITGTYTGSGGTTTLKALLDATKNASRLFQGYSSSTVEGLIVAEDTSNVTDMGSMFGLCHKLTTIPQLDTSNVANMGSMFYECFSLTTIPQLDTSKVTDMNRMFFSCTSLTTIPQLDTSKVISMDYMFSVCGKLTTIPQLDVSKVISMTQTFNSCTSLKSILMTGMKVSFDISASTQFETADLVTILNNLATVTTSQTLTMGATNLAKLSDEQKKIATDKGWTLA